MFTGVAGNALEIQPSHPIFATQDSYPIKLVRPGIKELPKKGPLFSGPLVGYWRYFHVEGLAINKKSSWDIG